MRRIKLAFFATIALSACSNEPAEIMTTEAQEATSACSSSKTPVSVEGGWLRTVASEGGNTAAYFVVCNNGDAPLTIVGASAEVASATEIHRTVRDESNVVRMAPAGDIPIEPGSYAEFEPGGLHVMLMGINAPLSEGATQRLTLQLADGGVIEVIAPVRQQPPSEMSSSEHGEDHSAH